MIKGEKLKRLIEIGCIPSDSPEERLSKKIMTIMIIPYSLAGILWGLYFIRNGNVISGLIPFVYGIVSLTTFFHFIYTKRYNIFRFSQVGFILVLPFFLQLSLGGFSQSSGMLLWSCTAPFIALIFYDFKTAKKWFYALVFVLVLACFLDESAREYFSKEIDANSIVGVYGANFILISSLIFSIQIYFLNGMKKIKIELGEKEMLLESSAKIKEQKELLIASKERLELVMGSLEEVVWGRNLPDYQIQYVSNSAVNLYGFPLADWYENPNLWTDMIHPDEIKQVQKEGESLFTEGFSELEFRIITPDKKIKWIHSTTRILKSADGTPFFMTGIARDITEEKKVQNQLNQLNNNLEAKAAELQISNSGLLLNIAEMDVLRSASEAVAKELRQFIETANAPIFGIDDKGNVNEWNQSSEKITGFKKEEVLGKDLVATYITEDYREAVKGVLDNALKGKETANFEFPLFSKDGQRVLVLLNSSTRRNSDGEITGVLGVGQDISQIDKLRSNLEDTVKKRTFELEDSLEKEKELGKLKTSFVAMASHEFRTPLAAIQAATDVILKYNDKLSQEDIKKRLFKIKREVSGMTIMLEDILIIGKADSQKLQFNAIEQDLVVLVKNIVSDYQLTQVEVREVIYRISRDEIMLNADPKWIKHIILNLLSNAVKYSEAPTSIRIEIRQEENEIILSVTDKGIGISEKDQESLFEPFHRGKNVGNIQGTGLGLSVLQTAIDLHKGKIKVESKLNNGSTFIVSLPHEGTI
jgi:PAS domain S-box-containing protein